MNRNAARVERMTSMFGHINKDERDYIIYFTVCNEVQNSTIENRKDLKFGKYNFLLNEHMSAERRARPGNDLCRANVEAGATDYMLVIENYLAHIPDGQQGVDKTDREGAATVHVFNDMVRFFKEDVCKACDKHAVILEKVRNEDVQASDMLFFMQDHVSVVAISTKFEHFTFFNSLHVKRIPYSGDSWKRYNRFSAAVPNWNVLESELSAMGLTGGSTKWHVVQGDTHHAKRGPNMTAFLMGSHDRLGQKSAIRSLKPDTMESIANHIKQVDSSVLEELFHDMYAANQFTNRSVRQMCALCGKLLRFT